jgi:chaperone required for assembly of F1-ATPase
MRRPRRFYREVGINRLATGQWQVRLDHKPAATPAGKKLHLPNERLAEAIAGEWRSQSEEIHPETLGLNRLANTAIDRIESDRQSAVAEILKFAGSDLLCFRASGPDLLVTRQSAVWDPLLDWATEHYKINLETVCGITPIRQPVEDFATLESFLLQLDDFALAALVAAANILGSAVLALALMDKRLDPQEALAAAELDAAYQAEFWGEDPEVTSGNRKKSIEIELISRFMALAGAV